jgi:hypothetical protein
MQRGKSFANEHHQDEEIGKHKHQQIIANGQAAFSAKMKTTAIFELNGRKIMLNTTFLTAQTPTYSQTSQKERPALEAVLNNRLCGADLAQNHFTKTFPALRPRVSSLGFLLCHLTST